MQIGDKVWIFDSNNRQYKDDKGNKLDRCWYRGYFKERYIIGETKQSWIIGFEKSSIEDRTNLKVNKKTLIYSTTNTCGFNGKLYISEEQVDQECWLQDNYYKIQEQVRRCRDYNKLKKIEEILLEQEDK
jgi:hypothetical protein